MKEGKLIVVSGPSGVGKDTIVNEYLKIHPEDEISVSMTSRGKREGETEGLNYYFRTKEEFQRYNDSSEPEIVKYYYGSGTTYGYGYPKRKKK